MDNVEDINKKLNKIYADYEQYRLKLVDELNAMLKEIKL